MAVVVVVVKTALGSAVVADTQVIDVEMEVQVVAGVLESFAAVVVATVK